MGTLEGGSCSLHRELRGPAARIMGKLFCGVIFPTLQNRSYFGGAPILAKLPANCGRAEVTLEGMYKGKTGRLGRAGPKENTDVRYMVLSKYMEYVRTGSRKCKAIQASIVQEK